ncbi:HotDog domain-containing protein [Triangularia setosa]|uniref:HotDog domain-containing protein n=1 Tax=Triangularia setosa TaxID=2587417 RepID=A0AAN6WHI6_9PEZI|nr:HotDog domain-containing protein [Podospora setosa]
MSQIAQTPAPIGILVTAKQANSTPKRLASYFITSQSAAGHKSPRHFRSCLVLSRLVSSLHGLGPDGNVETGTAPSTFPPCHPRRSPKKNIPSHNSENMVPRIPTYHPFLRLAAQRHHVSVQTRPNFLAVAAQFSTSRPCRNQPPPLPPSQSSEPLPVAEPLPPPPTEPLLTKTIPNPPRPRRRLIPSLLFAGTFLLLGTVGGSTLRLFISPPTPPSPDTEEDNYVISTLQTQASHLPIVQQLSSDPAWISWEAYNTLSSSHRSQHITAHTLRGSRGVGGYQRIFHNPSTGELVSVIFFGPATIGWPGVVHGGCLATILDESCGRAAFKQWGGLAGVTANLNIEYKRATLANGFYVIRVRSRTEEELPEKERGKRHYKSWVDAVVEDPVTGQVTVKAEALFVGGKGSGKGGEKKKFSWGGKVQESHAEF